MADRRPRRTLVTAWLTGGRQLRAQIPSARLNASGTGIDMEIRPGLYAKDMALVRWWLAQHAPRVFDRLKPGFAVEYDNFGQRRRG